MKRNLLATLIFPLLFFLSEGVGAQDKAGKKEVTFAETVKNCDLHEGLFNLYQDRDDGTIYIAIQHEQIDKEYIHYAYVLNGVPALGMYRGRFLHESTFSLRKWYNKIEFVGQNTAFHFDSDSALARSADANISEAVIASPKIVATSEDKTTYLLKADDLFLKELFSVIKPAPRKNARENALVFGSLSSERTRFSEIRNYPENTLLRVNYVYHNSTVKGWGDDDVTDARYITANVQHALVAVPKNNYRVRREDPRVGYFASRKTDLTSKKSANYRDLINRWNLVPKNPGKTLSEPVKPITWWIENTTPNEFRDTIKEAVETWNLAFQSAGFKNAVVCKVQPDDAKWDAGDIRYNVLRWTSSPDPPFGGYGPSFVNPRTGEILGADIMLEYVYVTNRIRLRNLLQSTDPIRMDENRFPFNRLGNNHRGQSTCSAGFFKQDDAIGARASLVVAGASKVEVDTLIQEALFELILHEVGHTLGLSHNFKASYLHTPEQLNDKERTSKMGMIASVMDYSPANIARDRNGQGHYYSKVPGPYDHWAIRYGYTPTTDANEKAILNGILAESTKPEHGFGNDADDMRRAGSGIDPQIMINDLSSDPVAHAIDSMERVRETMDLLLTNFPESGDDYHEMRGAASSLMRTYQRSAVTLSRHVGGVHIDRSFHDQKGRKSVPYRPVDKEAQEEALVALSKYVMKKGAFDFLTPDLIAHLQLKRRGFSNNDLDANEDPKIHSQVKAIQDDVLNHLLHKNTLQRIVDTSLYGNELSLGAMMEGLHTLVFGGKTDTFREGLQIDYVKRLVKISGLKDSSDYPTQAQSQAIFWLEQVASQFKNPRDAHGVHLKRLAENALAGK